jgi:DNA-binding transcriptional LysR family regulator
VEMHQIRYFLAVSRILNFTRAAEECHVAQPSLTRAIKLLEAELGGDLFRRERNLTHMTEFGLRMLPLLQQCYDSALSAKKLASSFKSGGVATLTLALSQTVPISILVEPLTELVRTFPRLELKVLRGRSSDVAEHLKKGEAVLAVAGPLQESWDRLDAWPLFSEPFEAIVHPDHRLAAGEAILVGDLARGRILARPYCELQGSFDELLKSLEAEAEGRHEVGSDDDLLRLVEADLGIGVLPRSTPSPSTVKRLPLEGLEMSRTISLYGVSGRERSPPATALLKLLRARDWSLPR